jgi:hypothetical protein
LVDLFLFYLGICFLRVANRELRGVIFILFTPIQEHTRSVRPVAVQNLIGASLEFHRLTDRRYSSCHAAYFRTRLEIKISHSLVGIPCVLKPNPIPSVTTLPVKREQFL